MSTRMTPEDWTPERVRKYWDFLSQKSYAADRYFAKMVGEGLSALLAAADVLDRRTLDYGCGGGHLMEHFLARGMSCAGVDSSSRSVDSANSRLRERRGFLGASVLVDGRIPHSDATFGLVTCTETL